MRSAGLVLAAGGIAAANEVFFAPLAKPGAQTAGQTASDITANFNWRIVPATLVLALMLGGLEQAAPGFATGLGGLVLLSVLVVPIGKAPTPVENLSKIVAPKKG